MKKKKEIRMRGYADIGSHGHIFMFAGGEIADKYPTLLHIYRKKVTANLKRVTIIYKI